jgi:hypothetical protein
MYEDGRSAVYWVGCVDTRCTRDLILHHPDPKSQFTYPTNGDDYFSYTWTLFSPRPSLTTCSNSPEGNNQTR